MSIIKKIEAAQVEELKANKKIPESSRQNQRW